jgi:branched-chain amino acid transport system substrate-binding protein
MMTPAQLRFCNSLTSRPAGRVVVVALAAVLSACSGNTGALTGAQSGAAGTATGSLSDRSAEPAIGRGGAAAEAPARRAAAIKVGLLLPLSGAGQAGLIADTMRKAAELALIEQNAPHVQLIVRDDKGSPEGASAAAREVTSQGVEIILGPLFARSVQAAAQVARPANVPIVAFSNDKQVAGQGVSLLSFLAEPEVHRVVAYAAAQKKKRFIALVPDDAYGRLVEATFRAAVARHGGEVAALEVYPAQANGMLDAVRRLRDATRGLEEHGDPVDALFLPGGEETLATLSPQLKQAQFDLQRIKVIGTGGLDYPNAGRDPQLAGAWFAAPDPRGWQDFSAKYAKAYGHAPPRIAALAYDAVGLVTALSNGPDGARFIPSNLNRSSGFIGADGPFRMAADGTTERALAVLEVQQFAAKVIDLAASGFGATLTDGRVAPTVTQTTGQTTALITPAATQAAGTQAAGPQTNGPLSRIPSAFPVN